MKDKKERNKIDDRSKTGLVRKALKTRVNELMPIDYYAGHPEEMAKLIK